MRLTIEYILNKIISYYINSKDFNGYPSIKIEDNDLPLLKNLIQQNLIEIISSNEVNNPFIKAMNLNISQATQIKNLYNHDLLYCIYPTKKALVNIHPINKGKYSIMLEKGEEQFKIIFFKTEVLDFYFKNPEYIIFDQGCKGTIAIKDEYYDKGYENVYIKDFGMGYIKGDPLDRVVGIMLADLYKLSNKQQGFIEYFEYKNQEDCYIHPDYLKSTILGEWLDNIWIFDAILYEQLYINELCEKMNIPHLFKKSFNPETDDYPENYRTLIEPTSNNYYEFISEIEKMFVHSLSYDFFKENGFLIKSVERKNIDGTLKGSLQMFEEWLEINVKEDENVINTVIKPLKNIRRIRQIPAHQLIKNDKDKKYFEDQHQIIVDLYKAIKYLRLFFNKHPLCADFIIPNFLDKSPIIFY